MGTSTPVEISPPGQATENDTSGQQVVGSSRGTITASQLAALLSLVFVGCCYAWNLVSKLVDMNHSEDIFAMEFYVVLMLTALYYIISEWATEEIHGEALRKLKCAWPEFLLRVGLTCLLIWVATGLAPDFSGKLDLTPLHAQALGLAVVYWLFLSWDTLVTFAGHHLESKMLWGDFLGGLLAVALLWCHARHVGGGFLLILAMFGISLMSMTKSATDFHLVRRIFDPKLHS